MEDWFALSAYEMKNHQNQYCIGLKVTSKEINGFGGFSWIRPHLAMFPAKTIQFCDFPKNVANLLVMKTPKTQKILKITYLRGQ